MPLIYAPHDPRRHDTRLYKGGGDGGAGAMREQEQDRQRKVQEAVDVINARFGIAPNGAAASYGELLPQAQAAQGARQRQYADISSAVRDTAMRDLDRQFTQASRANKFGLARSGLLGGSADAEAGGELQTLYGEGKLKAQQAGMGAAADLRTQDERTRQNLVSLAQSGLDTGTAASMAAGQLASAADLAKSQAATASVGDLFGRMSQAYLTNQVLRTRFPNGVQQQPTSTGYGGANNFTGRREVGRITE